MAFGVGTYLNASQVNNIESHQSLLIIKNDLLIIVVKECGKIDEEPVALVVHGWNAKPGQWPWYAPLYCFEDGNWTFWCGSTLISESVVLTGINLIDDNLMTKDLLSDE